MAEFSPDCRIGAVSFCQQRGRIDWESIDRHFTTKESRDDYAKFQDSLMSTYSSLVCSAATENQVPFGWYANEEIQGLVTYYFNASLRSSRHKRHNVSYNKMAQDVLLEREGFSSLYVNRYKIGLMFELSDEHHIHGGSAYRKSLMKCDFIKLDSDFDEILQRLKNRWPLLSDDHARVLLENHFSLLRELNDNLGVIDVVNAGNRLEGNRVMDAINKLYAKKLGDSGKHHEEKWINMYFVPHMKFRKMVTPVLKRRYVPQDNPVTIRKLFEPKNGALLGKNWILDRLSPMRVEGGYWGPITRRVHGMMLFVVASLGAVGIGKKHTST